MTRDELAALGGVLPAVITRKTKAHALWGPAGEYDPKNPINLSWLYGRWSKMITDAQVFGVVPLGWTAYALTIDGKPVFLWMNPDIPGGSQWGRWLPGSDRFAISDDSTTARELKTGKVYQIEAVTR